VKRLFYRAIGKTKFIYGMDFGKDDGVICRSEYNKINNTITVLELGRVGQIVREASEYKEVDREDYHVTRGGCKVTGEQLKRIKSWGDNGEGFLLRLYPEQTTAPELLKQYQEEIKARR